MSNALVVSLGFLFGSRFVSLEEKAERCENRIKGVCYIKIHKGVIRLMGYEVELEKFFTKTGEKSTQYMYFKLEKLSDQRMLYIVKGRLLELMRTERETSEHYNNVEDSKIRVDELIQQLIDQGFSQQNVKFLEEADIQYAYLRTRKKSYVYDKAKWHYDNDYPKHLDDFQAYIHTGMFITWAILNNLISAQYIENYSSSIDSVKQGTMSGAKFFEIYLDGTLSSNALSEEGNAFAYKYLNKDDNLYLKDYIDCFTKHLPSEYHVQDFLENYKKIEPIITARYRNFKNISIHEKFTTENEK